MALLNLRMRFQLLGFLGPVVGFCQTVDEFNLPLSESHPIRVEQAAELDRYIKHRQGDHAVLAEVFSPDYSSPSAYEASGAAYRHALEEALGYPSPSAVPAAQPRFEPLGEDRHGVYRRMYLEVLPGVNVVGIYVVPKGVTGPVPLILSLHGGGGSPERALFNGGANYHDMVRGAVKRGYAVFAPQMLFSSEGLPKEIRRTTDRRLRHVGTTIAAVELLKIRRALDVLATRPEVDPSRIGVVGLSYGGFYAQLVAALDLRIKVVVNSCYFGVQEGRYARDELTIPSDFEILHRFTLFRDEDVAALVCPRPYLIQAGSTDGIDHREPGKALAVEVAAHYERLGLGERFRHLIFDGKHEFHDASAWAFVEQHLPRSKP